jgi:hypothetical protein
MIAWFPNEGVIRLIGRHCYRRLNPEGHRRAELQYREEQEAQSLRRHLLTNIPKIGRTLVIIEQAALVATAVEQVHARLREGLRRADVALWPEVRDDGKLKVQTVRQRDGSERVISVPDSKDFRRVHGYGMLAPELMPMVASLRDCAARLRPYDFGHTWEAKVGAMNDERAREAADVLNASMTKAKDLIRRVEDLRQFVEPVNINALKNWGTQSGCPIKVHFSLHHNRISVGRHADRSEFVDVPPAIFLHIPPLDFWTPREKTRKQR